MTGLEMRYFILKPSGNTPYHRASRAAMQQYAKLIREQNPKMAHDLTEWATKETISNETWKEENMTSQS